MRAVRRLLPPGQTGAKTLKARFLVHTIPINLCTRMPGLCGFMRKYARLNSSARHQSLSEPGRLRRFSPFGNRGGDFVDI
jgi:hypothetical protein